MTPLKQTPAQLKRLERNLSKQAKAKEKRIGLRVRCNCEGWKKSVAQIFDAQIQHTLRTGVQYTGKQFKHCPWCGKTLERITEDE